LKVSISKRLFLAVLLSILAVAAAGLELVRWRVFDDVSGQGINHEWHDLGDLIDALSAKYRQHQNWSFLPADDAGRKAWLRKELSRLQQRRGPTRDANAPSPSLGYRIGVLDRDGRYLTGEIANPVVIAFASIDTIRQPLLVDGERIGYLVLIKSQNPDDGLAVAFLVEQQQNILLIALVGVLLSALTATWLAAHFRKPIGQLVRAAQRLEEGRFDMRLNLHRSDELGRLADTFNHLAARLEDVERSRKQWVAVTSHELRTPLAVLRGQIEGLQDGVIAAVPDNIAIMQRQVLTLTKLVDELHELACGDVGHLQYHKTANDMWRIVQEIFDDFAGKFRTARLTAAIRGAPMHTVVYCDADRMRQVVTNLLENSVRYTSADGRIDVHGALVEDELHIVIDDSSPGVPEASIERLGERFFRLESSRNRRHGGAGLGLALSRQILEAHSGRLQFAVSPFGGLRAIIVMKLESSQ
jgi:two-component system, OmpR family, sensor histidine kinase BaeS